MAAEVVRIRTIHRVFKEFLDWRGPSLEPEALRNYREVLDFFELSINQHAVEHLDGGDEGGLHGWLSPARGSRRRITEIFGPDKIPSEIHRFLRDSLYEYSPRLEVLELAPNVVADLCSWLVWRDYVSDSLMEEIIDAIGAQGWSHGRDSVNF